MSVPGPDRPPRGLDSLRFKVGVYIACWLLALLATNPDAGLLPLIYMFPLGLFAFFFPQSASSGGWGVLLGTLAFYWINALVYFRSRTRSLTMIMLVVLVLALICNVSGCRRMIDTH